MLAALEEELAVEMLNYFFETLEYGHHLVREYP